MGLTARDIRMKDFRHSLLGGYSVRDVDAFLMNLAVDVDRRDRHAEAQRAAREQTPGGEEVLAEAHETARAIVEKAKQTARTGLILSRERAEQMLLDARESRQEAARLEAEAQLRLAHVERGLEQEAEALAAEARRLAELAASMETLDLGLGRSDRGNHLDHPAHTDTPESDTSGEIVQLKRAADN